MPLSLLYANDQHAFCLTSKPYQTSNQPLTIISFIANFGVKHSREEEVEKSINENYELISLTIWVKSFRIVGAFSCYVTSFQTNKTLGKRKSCVEWKQHFIG